MGIVSSVICLFGGNVAALESPFDISCQGPWVASESEGGTALCQWSTRPRFPNCSVQGSGLTGDTSSLGPRIPKVLAFDQRWQGRSRSPASLALATLHKI